MTAAAKTRNSRHFDSLEQETFLSLWRTYDRLRIEEDLLFERYGLTPQQYNALRILHGALPAGIVRCHNGGSSRSSAQNPGGSTSPPVSPPMMIMRRRTGS